MLEFLTANIATIVVLLIVAAVIVLIIYKMSADKKQGKSSCGCNCKGCANALMCHGNNNKS